MYIFLKEAKLVLHFLIILKIQILKPLCKDFVSKEFKNPLVIIHTMQNHRTLMIIFMYILENLHVRALYEIQVS
jgi:hypothetical protein